MSARSLHVAIVGPGLIGGSLGLALRRSGAWRVLAVARSEEAGRAAVEAGAADGFTASLEAGLADADAVVMCAPLAASLDLLPRVMARSPAAALITDVAGVKRAVHEAATLPEPDVRQPAFIGGHPMAGRERSGLAAAEARLFEGAPWVLTHPEPAAAREMRAGRLAERLARDAGAEPVWMTPEEHDRVVALVSHLPQCAATALACAVGGGAQGAAALAAGGFRDATRLAASPAEVWADVLLANADHVGGALAALAREVAALREALAARDRSALESLFGRANGVRAAVAAVKGWPS